MCLLLFFHCVVHPSSKDGVIHIQGMFASLFYPLWYGNTFTHTPRGILC